MNLETLNRYVLVVIGLFAVFLYLALAVAGFSEMISRMPKRKDRRNRSKPVAGDRGAPRNRPDLGPSWHSKGPDKS